MTEAAAMVEALRGTRFETEPVPDVPGVTRLTMRQASANVLLPFTAYVGVEALNRLRRMALVQAAAAVGKYRERAEALAMAPWSPPGVSAEWTVEQEGERGEGTNFTVFRCTVPGLPRKLCGTFRERDAVKAMTRFLDWAFQEAENAEQAAR